LATNLVKWQCWNAILTHFQPIDELDQYGLHFKNRLGNI
jgi:hypothetical protein